MDRKKVYIIKNKS